MVVEEAFAKVLGRQASDAERQRLYRVRDVLGLRDNDAFWYIVMILEHYDALYRDYPRQISDQVQSSIEGARQAFAEAAQAESAKTHKMLAERVAETSVEIARRLAEKPIGLHRVTTILAVVVLFGALCMTAGFTLASSVRPFWWKGSGLSQGHSPAFAIVLSAPAGWMAFGLLLPLAIFGGMRGWEIANAEDAVGTQKLLGWSSIGFCAIGAVGCAVALITILG